ncbi:MAG TPA: efflux RND transporter periplasmic adaptor subunit [Chthoniobacteraceae bacterium]|nr:efflux RND transporter periplasmic adaptor subunit [Chthoniobacteraceae bacterium]
MPKPKRQRRRLIILSIIALAILGACFWYYWSRRGNDVIAIQVENVTIRDITETVVANGKIYPVTQVLISPEVAGEIIELPVKEGQAVKKGDLLIQIKPDTYRASRNSAEASHKFAMGARSQAEAELARTESDFRQNEELYKNKLVSSKVFTDSRTAYEVARLQMENSIHQADQARFSLEKANEDLAKTTISSPIDGTVTKLKSQLGERVLGTSFNMGTEIMTVARLDEMEARVDIGEVDVVLIQVGQTARIEADSFKDRIFKGSVTAIANASKGSSQSANMPSVSESQQEAPKFEVRIRVEDKEAFRPGMSVSAEIETRSRQRVLSVPIQSVTTRLPVNSNATAAPTPSPAPREGKHATTIKPAEVVFVLDGDHVKMRPVKTGISDSDHFEIIEGLREGEQVVSGGYKAISKDLEDGKKVKIGVEPTTNVKEAP